MAKMFLLAFLLVLSLPAAMAQNSPFRWIARSGSDSRLYAEVEQTFATELKPDVAGQTGQRIPLTVKYVERIGALGESALVIVGYKESHVDRYPVFRAFNLNLKAKETELIEIGQTGWAPMLRFERSAHFENPESQDEVFTYLSCTECEADKLLISFHYDLNTRHWSLRRWSSEDGKNLLIGSDAQFGEDGIYRYDCLHTIGDLMRNGLDELAVRCRETVQPNLEKTARIIVTDRTLLFTRKDGAIHRLLLKNGERDWDTVQSALCLGHASSPLCKTAPKASLKNSPKASQ